MKKPILNELVGGGYVKCECGYRGGQYPSTLDGWNYPTCEIVEDKDACEDWCCGFEFRNHMQRWEGSRKLYHGFLCNNLYYPCIESYL